MDPDPYHYATSGCVLLTDKTDPSNIAVFQMYNHYHQGAQKQHNLSWPLLRLLHMLHMHLNHKQHHLPQEPYSHLKHRHHQLPMRSTSRPMLPPVQTENKTH